MNLGTRQAGGRLKAGSKWLSRVAHLGLWLALGIVVTPRGVFAVVKSPPSEGGKVAFANRAVNFGKVIRGEELKHRFEFKNIGKAPLRIQGVHAACGCTIANVSSHNSLEPGGSAYIDVTFKTDNFVGPVTKVVTVMTNERLAPNRTLTLRADVQAEFIADPPVLDFGEVEDGSTAVATVKITPLANFPLVVKSLKFNTEALDVFSERKAGNAWLLQVKLKPMQKTGFLKESVMVASNSTALPEFKLVVRANRQGPIRFEPAYLEFGAIAREGKTQRVLKLQGIRSFARGRVTLELNLNGKPVADAAKYLSYGAGSEDGQTQDLVVTLSNLAPHPGSIHGKLYVETNEKVQDRLVVDIYGFFL